MRGKHPLKDYVAMQEGVIQECLRLLHPQGSLCWQVGNYVANGEICPLDVLLYPIFQSCGLRLRNRIIWHFEHGLHCTRRLSGRYETINWWTKNDNYTWNLDPIRVPAKYPNKKHFKGPDAGKLSGNPNGKNPSDVWVFPNVKNNHVGRRVPITYDLHRLLDEIGFDFIDDIVWQKPEGAGWHLGRGRRFAAGRQPLQYKAVTVTENITVYRKRTAKLIDWNIRNHPDQEGATLSRLTDDYERTNIWRSPPASHKRHPAVFPDALAERVIRYYSFRGDVVLDPFAGTGTTGRVAHTLGRRFTLIEKSPDYFDTMRADLRAVGPTVSYEYAAGAL